MSNEQLPEVFERATYGSLRHASVNHFSLFVEKPEDIEIERRIRDGVELLGATRSSVLMNQCKQRLTVVGLFYCLYIKK